VTSPLATTLSAQAAPNRAAGVLPQAQRRAELERAFRERTAEVVRRQLKLDDNQMTRLQAANQDFDRQRSALAGDERQTRQALRAELLAGDAANQQKVATYLDQMLRFQRRRIDIQENEQRELGKFLTPVQRAKYFGLQAQLRKRMMELRDRTGAGPGQPQSQMKRQMKRQMQRPGLRPMTKRPFR
ncbi:MAG: hypothetical protein ABI875_07980, partial [Gemmatimonadales bacterium]